MGVWRFDPRIAPTWREYEEDGRLVGIVLVEQDDEWQDGRCCFRPESMAAIDAVADRK